MKLFISFVLSFIAVRGFRFELTGEGYAGTNTNTVSFVWLLLFLFFFAVILNSLRETDRKLIGISCLFAFITAAFYIAGISFEKKESLSWIWGSRATLMITLNLLFSHAAVYYCFAFLAFRLLRGASAGGISAGKRSFSLRNFLLILGLLLVIYIPWYLFYFPGILTDDSNSMIFDALGSKDLSNHHSAFLVLVIKSILVPVRHLTGSLQAGIAVFIFLQMSVMVIIFSLTLERIFSYTRNSILRALAFLWYAAYPANTNYCMILWKDILFSGCFLAFLLCADRAAEDEDLFFGKASDRFRLFITALLLPLLRHNGLLITVLSGFCFFLGFKKYRGYVLRIFGCALAVYGIWTYAVLPAMNVKEVEPALMLSVPQQQIARTLAGHHSELGKEELAALEAYFDIPEIWNEYHALLSDHVKMHFRNEVFKKDPGTFFRLWLKLGLRYPMDYIEAFLHNNYGYWFPETGSWVAYHGMMVTERIEDTHPAPVLKSGIMDRIWHWYSYREYMKMPLLPLLFSPGAFFWLWLFCGCYCLYNNRRKFIVFIPGLSLLLGVLISPVYNEFRYVYGLIIGLPLLMASAFRVKRNDTEDRAPENIPAAYMN